MKPFTDYTKQYYLLRANRILQVLVAAAIIVLITPTKSSFKYEFQQGHYWKHETLEAPFDFAIQKTEKEIAEEKNEITANKTLYFDYSDAANNKMEEDFDKKIASYAEKNNLSDNEKNKLLSTADKILNNIIRHGIISDYADMKNYDRSIIVVNNNVAGEHEIAEFYNISDIEKIVNDNVEKNQSLTDKDGNTIADLLIKVISPNIIFNGTKTDEILSSQIDDISKTKGLILKNQKIIAQGEIITADKYQILSSLKSEYEGMHSDKDNTEKNLALIGQYLLIIIALSAMVLFIYNTDREIFFNNKKILLIFFIILMMVGITVGVLHINQKYLYVVPLCLTPILVRTFFDTKVSLYVFLVTIIIIGFSVPNSFEFVFYQLIAGMMAILSVEHLEKRVEFFKTAVIVFATYSIIYLAMTLIQDNNLKQLDIYRFIYFAANGIMLLFAFPIVFVLEKIFSLVSEMSLMEYSNTDSKILRELSVKAPGTFQHCIQVANIAEDLIHEIGGNALLVRAGSLYHDIGKLMTPMYFIENQNTGLNPHNELTNEESAQVIISHVTNGIKLAHRYKIPEPIIDFIRTHHGTSKTKYFYNKECNEHPNSHIDASLYTYGGPKPFSKETAVLMIVDSVEAASRSMKEHSEKSISNLVDGIIDAQIQDNQFTNANITFADVENIKQLLKKKLQSIYHVRIEYPVNQTNRQ
ncbi:MAG: HDIG domain-containing protein [Bacteroidales bacterium]|nr:HDIG domain-containing protein [Bacteroidales bacterium]